MGEYVISENNFCSKTVRCFIKNGDIADNGCMLRLNDLFRLSVSLYELCTFGSELGYNAAVWKKIVILTDVKSLSIMASCQTG